MARGGATRRSPNAKGVPLNKSSRGTMLLGVRDDTHGAVGAATAQLQELALGPAIPHLGFSGASRTISA
jgi:hypothetical protein